MFAKILILEIIYLCSVLASTEVSDVREFLDIYNKESSPLESFIFSQIDSSNVRQSFYLNVFV